MIFTLWPHYRDRFEQTVSGFSVKTEKHNYTEWTRLATNEVLAAELYDNATDPQETINVVDLPGYEETVLEISDNGSGIPVKIIDSVFEPFFTTKENGTGLGLAIVRQIIESHGGNVQVSSREGNGATFVISLPLP